MTTLQSAFVQVQIHRRNAPTLVHGYGQVSRDAGLLGNVAGVRTSTCTSTYTTSMVDCARVHRGDFCNMEVTVCLLSQSTLQNFVHGILCRKGLLTITGSFLVQPYLEK